MGRGASWGTPGRETSLGEPCWGRSQRSSSSRTLEEKRIHKRRLCLPTLGCSWGLHSQRQGQTEVTHWGDSEVTELVSDSICPSDQSYYGWPAEKNNCCGEFLGTGGSCGIVFGDRETPPAFPPGSQHPASAAEQHWHWLCLVKQSLCPEPAGFMWAEHSVIHCWQAQRGVGAHTSLWEGKQTCGKQSHLWPSEDGLIPTSLAVTQPRTDGMDVPQAHQYHCRSHLPLSSAALVTSMSSTKENEVSSYDELDEKVIVPAVCCCLTTQGFSCPAPLSHYIAWARKQTSPLMAEWRDGSIVWIIWGVI